MGTSTQHKGKGEGPTSQLISLTFTSESLLLPISVAFELRVYVFLLSGFMWSFLSIYTWSHPLFDFQEFLKIIRPMKSFLFQPCWKQRGKKEIFLIRAIIDLICKKVFCHCMIFGVKDSDLFFVACPSHTFSILHFFLSVEGGVKYRNDTVSIIFCR